MEIKKDREREKNKQIRNSFVIFDVDFAYFDLNKFQLTRYIDLNKLFAIVKTKCGDVVTLSFTYNNNRIVRKIYVKFQPKSYIPTYIYIKYV